MKLVVLRSKRIEKPKNGDIDYLQTFNTRYAEKVIGNLKGGADFCSVCGPDCIFCRKPYNRHYDRDIAGIIDFPAVLPYVLESPSDYVPGDIPAHDVLLVINIHEQILLEVLKICKHWGTKGAVVPLEAPHWISGATKVQANEICEQHDIEISFPKPFCSFKPPGGGALDAFRDEFHIGFPDVDLSVENGKITEAHVHVSAACGATYYIARWLVGRSLKDNLEIEVISKRLHSYPCTASMEWDKELDDTPLHIAGKAHYEMLP